MDNKKLPQNKKPKFYCIKCDYSTNRTSSWKKHLLTEKHNSNSDNSVDNKKGANQHTCQICGKSYKFRSGLSKHRKKCKLINVEDINIQNVFDESFDDSKMISKNELKSLLLELRKQSNNINKKLEKAVSQPKTVYNNVNNNNKMTINVFLNEQCKDAMNLTDFVNKITVSLQDLNYSKDNGFIDGVTNIFTKQLQDMKPTERPIHCTDSKRLQFYIKDDDKWEKDMDNTKIDSTITNIKLKQCEKISEWEKLNPTYREDPQLLDEWQNMIAGITENTSGNVLKEKMALKRRIASYIELKDAMGLT